jgi:hypothetical protein
MFEQMQRTALPLEKHRKGTIQQHSQRSPVQLHSHSGERSDPERDTYVRATLQKGY